MNEKTQLYILKKCRYLLPLILCNYHGTYIYSFIVNIKDATILQLVDLFFQKYSTRINLITVVLIQLCLSAELHETRTVGHWLCHSRGPNLTDHSSEQVPLSGSAGRPEGRIVSYLPSIQNKLTIIFPIGCHNFQNFINSFSVQLFPFLQYF